MALPKNRTGHFQPHDLCKRPEEPTQPLLCQLIMPHLRRLINFGWLSIHDLMVVAIS
jgi:hypothetical protein